MRRLATLAILSGLLVSGPPPVVSTGAAQETVPDRGGTWLERRLEALVPGLRVEGLEGAWRARPTARRITLSDDRGVWLTLERVALNLAPTALVRGELRLEELDADLARLDRLPEPATPPPPPEPAAPARGGLLQLPELPVDVSIDRLRVERLEIDASVADQPAAFSADGMAALRSGGLRARIDLRRLDAEGQARVDVALTPKADRLSAEVSVREPPNGIVAGLLGTPDHPFSLDLRLAGPPGGANLSLEAGLGSEVSLSAEGEVRATAGGAYGAKIQGRARAAPLLPPDLASLASPVEFALDADKPAGAPLALRSLRLSAPAGTATAGGTVDPGSEALDLRLSLDLAEAGRFAPLLPQGVAWSDLRATARVTGTLSEPAVELEAAPESFATGVALADAALGASPRLAFRAALPGRRVDATLDGAEGKLAMQGDLSEPIDVTARFSLPRLSALGAGSEGSLEVEVRAEGSLSDPTVTATARSDRVEIADRVLEGLTLDARAESLFSSPRVQVNAAGSLGDMPLSLALLGRPEGGKLRLEEGEARLGPARLTAAGVLDPAAPVFDGTLRLEATDLAPLARLGGVEDLAGRLTLEARLSPAPNDAQGFDARLDAPRLAYTGTEGDLHATADGTPGGFDWTVRGAAAAGDVSGRGRVTAEDGGAWRLRLAALEARAAGETLRLAELAQVVLGQDGGVRVPGGLALALGRGGRARVEGQWGPERADLRIGLSALPLAVAEPFAPGVEPQGTVSGEVRVTGPVSRPGVRAELRGTGIKAGADWARGLPVLALRAEGTLSGAAAQVRAEIEAGRAGRLTATARLPEGFGPRAPLAAALDGDLDLGRLADPFLSAGANRAAGRLSVALRAEGTVGAPRLGGRATLSGGDFRNVAYGVRVSGIEGVITGEGTRLVVERLRGRTPGNGTMSLRGSLDVGAPGIPADLALTATDARPVVSDLVSATLGADLRLTGPVLGGGTLAGGVRVQRAEIRIPERLPASVPTLTGVREVGTPPGGPRPGQPPRVPAAGAAAPPAPPLNLAVRVSAPRRVFVRGRGLDVELGGEVAVRGTVAEPVPQGELELRRGTLDVLARRLTFDRGTIDFASGTLTPRLDLVAKAQVRQTAIAVTVQGPATSPTIAVSSTPELPQDEILARLLFDRGTGDLSPLEIARLGAAAAELAGVGGGAGGVLDRARGALGLDRLGLSGGAAGAGPGVEAGRYVAPGVFLGARQGAQGRTGVGVEVEITPRLKLEGRTATGPAGDRLGLAYEFEY